MPEMPEVEIIRRYLDTVLTGQTIMKLDLLLPRQIKWPEPEAYRAMAIGRRIRGIIFLSNRLIKNIFWNEIFSVSFFSHRF